MAKAPLDDDWKKWLDAREGAMERVLGKCDEFVIHAIVPFEFGHEMGGAADVVLFRHHIPGVVYVTSELIGFERQIPNELGNYELMICHRTDENWGPDMISRLAYYTLDARLDPGDTMDIQEIAPAGSDIAALLFLDYARFEVRKRKAGLLLCLGITQCELTMCRAGRRRDVERALKDAQVYPYTDLDRAPVVIGKSV